MPRPSSPPAWWCDIKRRLVKFATFQLWPSRFWFWFCGGMNVAEAFFVLCYLCMNAWYFRVYYIYYKAEVIAAFESGLYMPGSYNLMMLEKWLGHVIMLIMTVHSLGYYVYWASIQVPFWHQFADWSGRSFINNLGGSIAFFAGLVLWTTSAEWCRRCFFEDFNATAKQDIFLQVPQIDRFAWHPFTIMQHKRQLDGTGLLTMQIKRYSDWTKELFVRGQVKGQQLRGKITGPLDVSIQRRNWEECSTAVMIGGGIGAVPLLAMLDDLVPRMEAGQAGTLGGLCVALPHRRRVLDHGPQQQPWLDIHLHITRKPVLSLSVPSFSSSAQSLGTPNKMAGSDPKLLAALPADRNTNWAAEEVGHLDMQPLAESPWGWRPKAVQPKFCGGLVEAIVLILTFAGALFATAEWARTTAGGPPESMGWLYGVLTILAQVIGARGLPYALCIFPLHAFRHFFNRTPMKYSIGEVLVPALSLDPMFGIIAHAARKFLMLHCPLSAQGHEEETPSAMDLCRLHMLPLGPGLLTACKMPQLHVSRPKLWTLLKDVVAEDCPGKAGYGVYVAGPPPMWDSLQKMVQAMRRGGVDIRTHQEAAWL
eukprot:jgi/Astpho2/742/Aster-00605